MKKLYALLVLILTVLNTNAQIINIPDANFKARLLASSPTAYIAMDASATPIKIDSNNNNEIEVSEALQVYTLNANVSNISSLVGINNFSNLTGLNIRQNSITSLNIDGLVNLVTINCGLNSFTSLDLTHSPNLQTVHCHEGVLTTLNIAGLSNLNVLNCADNSLLSLDASDASNLQTLICRNNQITSLDVAGLSQLATLLCDSNNLSVLNVNGLTNLGILNCSDNNISALDVTALPNLSQIVVSHNQLSALDFTNNPLLEYVDCRFNLITTLDFSVCHGLQEMLASNNQLTTLFIKNGSYAQNTQFQSNPLQYICADQNEIAGLQFYVNNIPNCHINSYCSFTPGGVFYTLQNTILFDSNNNGCDNNDVAIPNMKYTFSNGSSNATLVSGEDDSFNYVQAGTYTITPIFENPSYFSVTPASATITFPAANDPFVQNFCLTVNGTLNDLEVTLFPIGPARPGFDAHYKIIYKNKGTTTQSGAISFSYDDTISDLVSANPTISSQGTDILNWTFANLQPFESREISINLNLNSPVETPPLNANNWLLYSATATGATDETPDNNTVNLTQTVVNSFDPNDKTCVEGTVLPITEVGKYVHYIIRFENNGTANAQNIVVKDMIDTTKFDIATLIPINGSHPFRTQITSTNRVELIFENINLPFDDANNDGYVAFKIKTKPTLVEFDTFSNSASIYFDYNAPIVTDTYTTTVFNPLNTSDFEFGSVFSLSPVPTKDLLTITTKQTVEISSVNIYNTLGQLVQVNTNPNETIDVSGLQSGSYFIKIISDKGSATGKFIKE